MNLFESVKDRVSTRTAAEMYGLQVDRKDFCKCPFHDDKNPSMKTDRRFHCFGCNADAILLHHNVLTKQTLVTGTDTFIRNLHKTPSFVSIAYE